MTVNEYQQLAARTINKDFTPTDLLLNGVMGLCGESGEVIEIVKKYHCGKALDRVAINEELGDVAWYLAEIATALNCPLEDIFRANITKLQGRYPQGFKKGYNE